MTNQNKQTESDAIGINDLWCEKHSKPNRFRSELWVAFISSELVNHVLKGFKDVKTSAEVTAKIHENSPLCCYVGDETLFSIRVTSLMRLKGVRYLSRAMEEFLSKVGPGG